MRVAVGVLSASRDDEHISGREQRREHADPCRPQRELYRQQRTVAIGHRPTRRERADSRVAAARNVTTSATPS